MFCLTGRLTRRPAPRYGVPSRQAWPGECWPLTRSPQSTTWSERSWALSNATRIITKILAVFEVAAVDGSVVQQALQLPFRTLRTPVTAAAARLAGCDFILTRDPKRFRGSPVRTLTAEPTIALLRQTISRAGRHFYGMMASTSRTCPRNGLPSPSPFLAPATSPAMSTNSKTEGMTSADPLNVTSPSSRGSGTVRHAAVGLDPTEAVIRGHRITHPRDRIE
jgi:hypothetical protein